MDFGQPRGRGKPKRGDVGVVVKSLDYQDVLDFVSVRLWDMTRDVLQYEFEEFCQESRDLLQRFQVFFKSHAIISCIQ